MMKPAYSLLLISLFVLTSVCHADSVDDPFAANKDYANLVQKAQNGDHQAQFKLGLIYACPPPAVASEYKKAEHWLEQAAKAGNAEAQFDLGFVYYNDSEYVDHPTHIAESMKWREQARQNGIKFSKQNLGCLAQIWPTNVYINADDGDMAAFQGNLTQAKQIWLHLAESGNTRAQYSLGQLYSGRSLPYGYDKPLETHDFAAYFFYSLAAKSIHGQNLIEYSASLFSTMTGKSELLYEIISKKENIPDDQLKIMNKMIAAWKPNQEIPLQQVLTLESNFHKDDLSVACKSALETKPFIKLKNYWMTKPDSFLGNDNSSCIRIDDNKFIVSGGQSTANPYSFYCNFSKSNSCNSFDSDFASNLPDEVVREFKGENGQRFELHNTVWFVHDDMYGTNYYVLYLDPNKSGIPLVTQDLAGFGDNSGGGGCLSDENTRSHFDKDDEDDLSSDFHVTNEGQENVAITFHYIHENCKARTQKNKSSTYTFNGVKFIKGKILNGVK